MGLFLKAPAYNATAIKTVTASTTLTFDDDHVKVNGTYTMTLPVISTLHSNSLGMKSYKIENVSGVVTVSPGTGDTINDTTSHAINTAADFIVIETDQFTNNWKITYPDPIVETVNIKDDSIAGIKTTMGAHYDSVTVSSNGTTAVNVFGAAGAPAALTITSIFAIAKDTVANSEFTLTNGTDAVAVFDKLDTVGWMIGEEAALTSTSVASGDTLTVVSDSTGNAYLIINYTSV